jgi:hypothetical protein
MLPKTFTCRCARIPRRELRTSQKPQYIWLPNLPKKTFRILLTNRGGSRYISKAREGSERDAEAERGD